MFSTDIQDLQSKLNLNSSHISSYTATSTCSDIDLQYQLYSRYMHLSKQQFAIQQLIAIKDSQTLIDSFAAVTKADISRDAHSTMDTLSYDEDFENSLIHQFSSIERRSPKKLTRKGTRHSLLKPLGRAGEQYHEILSDIERNCAQKTFSVVKSLLNEHKKNLSKIIEVQKKQKNIRKMQEKTEKAEQQNAIFKIKLTEIQQKIKSKDDQIKTLKDKLNQLKIIDKENIRSPHKVLSVTTKSISEQQSGSSTFSCQNSMVSTYLERKQLSLNQRVNFLHYFTDDKNPVN